jgi:hypothetical protein
MAEGFPRIHIDELQMPWRTAFYTRFKEAELGLNPMGGFPDPTLGDALTSVSVLPKTMGRGGSTAWPVAGSFAASANSDAFAAFEEKAAATVSAPNSFAVAASICAAGVDRLAGQLTVECAEL